MLSKYGALQFVVYAVHHNYYVMNLTNAQYICYTSNFIATFNLSVFLQGCGERRVKIQYKTLSRYVGILRFLKSIPLIGHGLRSERIVYIAAECTSNVLYSAFLQGCAG